MPAANESPQPTDWSGRENRTIRIRCRLWSQWNGRLRAGAGRLLWRDGGDHPFALLQRRLLQFGKLSQFLQDVFHNPPAFVDVSHFTTAENNGNLYFVFVFEETDRLTNFGSDIVLAGLWPKSNFFCFGLVGALPRLLTFFVLVLAEIHDSADGRLFVGRNLNEIQTSVASAIESLVGRNNTVLSAIGTDYTNRRDADLIIDPRLNAFDCWDPFDLNK